MTHRTVRAVWHRLSMGVAAGACVLMVGCAQVKMAPPSASIENVQLARASGIGAVAVGAFLPDTGLARSGEQVVSIRGNSFHSPFDSSFAKYLQESLSVELRTAGLLDPASRTVIGGVLTKSEVEAGASEGTATLGARFKVERAGAMVYDKEWVESDRWPSSFAGAVAIPDAINHYAALYRRLVARLLGDDAFHAAARP